MFICKVTNLLFLPLFFSIAKIKNFSCFLFSFNKYWILSLPAENT